MRGLWRRCRRGLNRLFSTRWGTALVRPVITQIDRAVFRVSGGRATASGWLNPTLILETTGARSGQLRQTPLAYARDGGDYVVVGSNFGQEHHPAWTANLLKQPAAVVRCRGRSIPVRATGVTDERERARLWALMDEVYGGYGRYRAVTAGVREIRMFRLEPGEGVPARGGDAG